MTCPHMICAEGGSTARQGRQQGCYLPLVRAISAIRIATEIHWSNPSGAHLKESLRGTYWASSQESDRQKVRDRPPKQHGVGVGQSCTEQNRRHREVYPIDNSV